MNLAAYRKTAPYKVGELLHALDTLLGRGVITIRTLRFYGSRGIVPRPLGAPKYARYGYEHLLSILAAKMLQDRGQKLDLIATDLAPIREGRFDSFEEEVEAWLTGNTAREIPKRYRHSDRSARRIALTPHCTVEVESSADLRQALEEARPALDMLIEALR